jgi:hypothetical protein
MAAKIQKLFLINKGVEGVLFIMLLLRVLRKIRVA